MTLRILVNMGSREQDEHDRSQRNIFDRAHSYLDPHIRLVKNSIYIIAGVGVILIARSIHMAKIFTCIEDIPKDFITKHVRLLGRVTRIGEQGSLHVQHIPIIQLPFSVHKNQDTLSISLACINISPHGRKWLVDNINGKDVWFTLLYLDNTVSPARLHTDVQIPKILWNTSVNEKLIKQGLCRVASLDTNYSSFHEDKFLLKYLDRLIKLESLASQKKAGLWGSTKIQKTKKHKQLNNYFRIVKSILSGPFDLLKWLYMKIKK